MRGVRAPPRLGAVEAIYARTDTRTPDLGGAATTAEFTRALIALL